MRVSVRIHYRGAVAIEHTDDTSSEFVSLVKCCAHQEAE